MVGIYVLVTLLAQLSSPVSVGFDSLSQPAEYTVGLQQLNGIKVGTPVFISGNLVGSVSRIGLDSAGPADKRDQKDLSFVLNLKISPKFKGMLRAGTVALISSTVTTARVEPETVLELFVPPKSSSKLEEGARIHGYTSYEQFWQKGFNT